MKTLLKSLTGIVMAATMLMAVSCGSSRNATNQSGTAQGSGSASSRLETIINATGPWSTFTASGKVRIEGSKSLSSSMQIKMTRGKDIAISIRPLLGIEMAKLVVRNDSVIVIDKFDGIYMADKVSVLAGGLPCDVQQFQNILLGHPFNATRDTEPSAKHLRASVEGENLAIVPTESLQGYNYAFIYNALNQLLRLTVARPDGSQSGFSVDYEPQAQPSTPYATAALNAHTNLSGKAYTLALSYSGIRWNQPVDNSVTIPSNYRRLTAAEAFKMIERLGH